MEQGPTNFGNPLGYQIFHLVARNYVAFKAFNMSKV